MPRPSSGAMQRTPTLPSCSLRWTERVASATWAKG